MCRTKLKIRKEKWDLYILGNSKFCDVLSSTSCVHVCLTFCVPKVKKQKKRRARNTNHFDMCTNTTYVVWTCVRIWMHVCVRILLCIVTRRSMEKYFRKPKIVCSVIFIFNICFVVILIFFSLFFLVVSLIERKIFVFPLIQYQFENSNNKPSVDEKK